jgi:hypothetical protein
MTRRGPLSYGSCRIEFVANRAAKPRVDTEKAIPALKTIAKVLFGGAEDTTEKALPRTA